VQAGEYGAADANAESKAQAGKMASQKPTQTSSAGWKSWCGKN
jgi:hypothetical protein